VQHVGDIKNFQPTVTPAQPALPATDHQALGELIQPTAGNIRGVNTNWGVALKNFDSLSTGEQAARFQNPTAVRAAIRSQATKQNILLGLKSVASLAAAEEFIRRMVF
jgi:hypothetical protein